MLGWHIVETKIHLIFKERRITMSLFDRAKNAWNVFTKNDDFRGLTQVPSMFQGRSSGSRFTTERSSIADPVFNRIALDVSSIDLKMQKKDAITEYVQDRNDLLIQRLTYSANIDQTGRAFMQDLVYTMMTEGHAVLVPTEVDVDPRDTDSYDIQEMRVGTVVQWMTNDVMLNVYNTNSGMREQVLMPKKNVAIVYNPLFNVMNDSTGTLRRLIRKLSNLDEIDEDIVQGRLRLLIKLPFPVKTESKVKEAERRVQLLENQIAKSRNGIGYIDASEDVKDLGNPLDNNILDEIKHLTVQFYNQLGLSEGVFDGTAKEDELRVYYSRTIDPIMQAIVDEINRKFISKTSYTQGVRVKYHRDPFKLMPIDKVATIADTFKRNELLDTDEIRELIGFDARNEPGTKGLTNPNIATVNNETAGTTTDVAATGSKDGSALDSDL